MLHDRTFHEIATSAMYYGHLSRMYDRAYSEGAVDMYLRALKREAIIHREVVRSYIQSKEISKPVWHVTQDREMAMWIARGVATTSDREMTFQMMYERAEMLLIEDVKRYRGRGR